MLQLACIDSTSESTKIINLLHHLRTHLNICLAYGRLNKIGEEGVEEEDLSKRSNYYLMHFFEEILQYHVRKNGNNRDGQFKPDMENDRPIEVAARENCNELIKAVNGLEEDGVRQFWERAPNNQINVASVAMVMHYKSLILRNIIAQRKGYSADFQKLLEILEGQMEKI
ncbi:MAG: hypothetical protein LBI69_00050 [Puniceicoccales bacterium]|nr:hypothetical protein [Puniceicoccales bacterium]